jgi:hypothetical protein
VPTQYKINLSKGDNVTSNGAIEKKIHKKNEVSNNTSKEIKSEKKKINSSTQDNRTNPFGKVEEATSSLSNKKEKEQDHNDNKIKEVSNNSSKEIKSENKKINSRPADKEQTNPLKKLKIEEVTSSLSNIKEKEQDHKDNRIKYDIKVSYTFKLYISKLYFIKSNI